MDRFAFLFPTCRDYVVAGLAGVMIAVIVASPLSGVLDRFFGFEPDLSRVVLHQTRADDELLVVESGRLEAFVSGGWVKLGRGSVTFLPANTDRFIRQPAVGTVYKVIKWNPDVIKPPDETKKDAATNWAPVVLAIIIGSILIAWPLLLRTRKRAS